MNNVALAQPEQQNLPATLDRIESAIAIARKPEEINSVLALMDAAVAYAKRFYKDQQDVIQRAKGLRLQAERRLGEILRSMPKAKPPGANQFKDRLHDVTEAPTLAEIGIDKRTSSRAQKLAALPEKKFAAVVSGEIPIAQAIAAPAKKETAKSRENGRVQELKVVAASEGGTYLIAAMRNAFNALADGEPLEEKEKAIVMAIRLKERLEHFINKHQG